jgi:hypothetical protein
MTHRPHLPFPLFRVAHADLLQTFLVELAKNLPSDPTTLCNNVIHKSILHIANASSKGIHDIVCRFQCPLGETL